LTAEEEDDQAPPPPALPIEDQTKLRHFIDRSARIARAEEDLGSKALSVAIVGDSTTPLVDVLAAELARRYELPVGSLEFHHLDHGDYLLILANEEVARRVYNEGHPLQVPPFTVLLRWWSRFKNAAEIALPSIIDVELRGVPPHAWELETTEHLLDDFCWVQELHQDTINR
jgi:hypothetical protein